MYTTQSCWSGTDGDFSVSKNVTAEHVFSTIFLIAVRFYYKRSEDGMSTIFAFYSRYTATLAKNSLRAT